MSQTYTTLTVIGTQLKPSGFESELPDFPFAYFFTVPDEEGGMTLFPEEVKDVPGSGDFAAARLSALFPDSVVVLARADAEDTLRMRFFRGGDSRAEYETEPGTLRGEELPPSVRGFGAIATLFDITGDQDRHELETLLRAPRYDDEHGFGEAKERHAEIGTLLNLPDVSIGVGYGSLERGGIPNQIRADQLRHQAPGERFQHAGIRLRQFELYCAKGGESEGQIAARFLPDVISWEDDFLDEGLPALGTVDSVRGHVAELQGTAILSPYSTRASLPLGSMEVLEIDLGGDGLAGPIEHLTMWSVSKEVPGAVFARLCHDTPWSVWSHESRRTVVRSAVPPV